MRPKIWKDVILMATATQANSQQAYKQTPRTKPNPDPHYEWFTTIPGEWFKIKVLGEDPVGIIHSAKGYYVDENLEFQKETPLTRNVVGPLRFLTGREWVGIPLLRRTGIYQKEWQWGVFFPKTESGGENPVYEPKLHDKNVLSAFPLVSNYPLIFTNVDVQGRSDLKSDEPPPVAITIKTIARIRMLRPRIALMQNKDWLGNGVAQVIRGGILDFVKNKTYDQIVRKAELNRGGSDFRNMFLGTPINDGRQIERSRLRRSMLQQYGVDVIDFTVVDIDANEAFEKQLQELANADIIAEILLRQARANREKRELEADAEKIFIQRTAEALKERLQMMRDVLGDSASVRAVEYAHALRDSKLTTLASNGIGIVVGADGQIR